MCVYLLTTIVNVINTGYLSILVCLLLLLLLFILIINPQVDNYYN